jgi:hypothetical protein
MVFEAVGSRQTISDPEGAGPLRYQLGETAFVVTFSATTTAASFADLVTIRNTYNTVLGPPR